MQFEFWTAAISLLLLGGGVAVTADTYQNGQLELPNWLWYTIGAAMLFLGAGVLFGIVKLAKEK